MSLSDPFTFDNVGDHINQCLKVYPLNAHQKYIIKEMLDALANTVSHELFMAGCGQNEAVKNSFSKVAAALRVEDRLRYR